MLLPAWLLLASPAGALECLTPSFPVPMPGRPDSLSGLFSFDEDDVIEWLDGPEGRVRVHYSVSGTNVTILDDDDANGLPDFAEEVASSTEAVMDAFEAAGFRRPLSEADLGLGALGGSGAFDVYLVDFAGQGDGMFAQDACESEPYRCSGYFVMENDFRGYGYGSLSEAIRVLTSHELFHAVQAAYEAGSPIWYTEGTAVWAERLFDPENEDFLWFADAYLEDTARSLDEPPTGPVPSFAYGTCLWWDFLSTRLGTAAIVTLQESLERSGGEVPDTLVEMERIIEASGATLKEEWHTFATWNLATKGRAGALEGHLYASEIGPVEKTVEGWPISDDNRFYPLAASYYRLDHPGGPLWFANADDATGLVFSLHPVRAGAADGPVEPAVATWDGGLPGRMEVAEDLPAGGWFLVGSHPVNASSSQKVLFCLGDAETVSDCVPPEDTGSPGDTGEDDPGGCACGRASPRAHGWLLGLAALALGTVRRRRG